MPPENVRASAASARDIDDVFPDLAVSYVSKSDMVSATLRELIVTGSLPAGSQLRQRDLAARFGVSPTPVREALRRLEAQGLVVSDTHKGATVVEGDFGATEQNYRIRAALEGEIAAMSAELVTEDDLDEIEDLARRFAATRKGDPMHATLNSQFHFRIYEAARSALAMSLLRLLWQAFPDGPQAARPHAQSVEQHAALVEALRAHDSTAAAKISHDHILGALPYIVKQRGKGTKGKRPKVTGARNRT